MPARWSLALAAVSALVGASCARHSPTHETAEEGASRARAVLEPFKTKLKATLGAALAKGQDSAIDACAGEAPRLAAEASRDGVRVGRSSARLRSAANAPPAWVAAPMAELARAPREGDYRLVQLEDGRLGFAETILVKSMCLGCHGRELGPETAARLASRYPKDEARGYAEGDFRGVFWAELPPTTTARR